MEECALQTGAQCGVVVAKGEQIERVAHRDAARAALAMEDIFWVDESARCAPARNARDGGGHNGVAKRARCEPERIADERYASGPEWMRKMALQKRIALRGDTRAWRDFDRLHSRCHRASVP